MKKKFLFKGVSVLGAVLLLATSVMPGLQYAYATQEVGHYSDSIWEWDYINNEEAWNASYASGALKKYYEKYPSEDLWNVTENRAINFNDKVYTARVYLDAEGEGEYVEKQFAAFWLSDYVQQITEVGTENVYYIPMFYNIPQEVFEMFCIASGGVNATVADLSHSSEHYIRIVSAEFSGEGVGHSWNGTVNAPGSTLPWIVVNFVADYKGGIKFSYSGLDDVYPRGTNPKIWTASSGFGVASLWKSFGKDSFLSGAGFDFDIGKFSASLISAHNLTIHYVNSKGATMFEDYTESVLEGLEYSVPSEKMDNYTINETGATVSGTMGQEDIEETVVYTLKEDVSDVNENGIADEEEVYNIEYALAGGTLKGENPTSYTVGVGLSPDQLTGATKRDSDFGGWFLDAEFANEFTGFEPNTTLGDKTFYARWNTVATVAGAAHFEGDATATVSEIVAEENVPASNDEAEKAKDSKDNLVNPSDVGYNATVLGGIEIYARDANQEVVTGKNIIFETPFDITNLLNSLKGKGKLKIKAKHHGKNNYTFEGLVREGGTCSGGQAVSGAYNGEEIDLNTDKILTCQASTFVAYTDQPAPAANSGGGGGSSRKSTETNTGSVTTGAVENATGSTEILGEENKDETANEDNKAPMTEDAAVAKFGQEQIDAYKWALENGITTMKTVEEARLDQPLTRAELAKMMVVYIQKVLVKQPILTGDVDYKDVKAENLGDLAGYIKLAYQYQIMGINADGTPIEYFNPNGLVTRGEYATVFSRVLFGSKFNKEGSDFYTNHLEALKAAGILKDTTPTMKEIRGWVMLMMYRSSQNIKEIEKVAAEVEATDEEKAAEAQAKAEAETNTEEATGTVVGIANPASVYCEEQGGTLSIVEDAEGNQSGMCKLADGTEVEEWEYYRANHTDEAATGDVVEAPEAEAATGDAAEAPEAEANTGDTASN